LARMGIFGYENCKIENFQIDENMDIEHSLSLECTWKGKIRDCIERVLGRHYEGYEYLCPRCKRVIHTDRHVFYE